MIERRNGENLGDWYYKANPYFQRGYGLPNCTAYAWGRLSEICNASVTFYGGNAIMWANRPEMVKLDSPKQGSCIIYSGGIIDSRGRFCGHIGVVEHLYSDGSIDVSMSSYGGYTWRLYRLRPQDNYHVPDTYGLSFYGFYMYTGVQSKLDEEARIREGQKKEVLEQIQKSTEIYSGHPTGQLQEVRPKVQFESANIIDALPICIVLLIFLFNYFFRCKGS